MQNHHNDVGTVDDLLVDDLLRIFGNPVRYINLPLDSAHDNIAIRIATIILRYRR